MNGQTDNGNKIYQVAKNSLGKALSGTNSVYGCAITVNNIVEKATGSPVGGGYSTNVMYSCFQDLKRFIEVSDPLPGDFIISPTGYSKINLDWHGHVGIVAKFGILSNSSEDGMLHENYTLDTWKKIFGRIKGFPVKFYRML